jgi:hypothetical protein
VYEIERRLRGASQHKAAPTGVPGQLRLCRRATASGKIGPKKCRSSLVLRIAAQAALDL